jgi:glycerol-3-phosphate acyltransferase PlsY
MTVFLFAVFGYFIGSIPFSYLVPKFVGGIDIRDYGSGNVGSTNVFRKMGKKIGAIAFAGDFLKGVAAGFIGFKFGGETGSLTAAFFAMVGHCYPVWIGFKGGKGVAVSGGAILGVAPFLFLLLMPVQIVLIAITRYVSLSSILTAICFPIAAYLTQQSPTFVMIASAMSAFVIFKHNSNIKKLLAGTESRLGKKKELE